MDRPGGDRRRDGPRNVLGDEHRAAGDWAAQRAPGHDADGRAVAVEHRRAAEAGDDWQVEIELGGTSADGRAVELRLRPASEHEGVANRSDRNASGRATERPHRVRGAPQAAVDERPVAATDDPDAAGA